MNERIKELLVQSGLLDYTKIIVPEHEKFAELIVKECAKIAEKEQVYNDTHEIHVNIDQCILIEFGL